MRAHLPRRRAAPCRVRCCTRRAAAGFDHTPHAPGHGSGVLLQPALPEHVGARVTVRVPLVAPTGQLPAAATKVADKARWGR